MRDLSDVSTEDLEAEIERRRVEHTKGCTGIAAAWCPIHGDCTCPYVEGVGYTERNDPDCPLHNPQSDHADYVLMGVLG